MRCPIGSEQVGAAQWAVGSPLRSVGAAHWAVGSPLRSIDAALILVCAPQIFISEPQMLISAPAPSARSPYRFGLAGESRLFHDAMPLARRRRLLSGPRVRVWAHFRAERFDGGVGSLLNLRAMPRPSTFAAVFLSLCAVALLGGCTRTIYSDMYSPRRNYFKPVKEQPKPTEDLPTTTLPSPSVPPSVPSTVPAIPPPTVAPPDLPPPVPAPVP